MTLIIGARFIPGGRTAATFAAGTLDMRWRRFLTGDLVGAFSWALITSMLGYLGGQAFQQSMWKPLLLSFGVSVVVIVSGELGQRRSRRNAAHTSASSEQRVSEGQDGESAERTTEEGATAVERTFTRLMSEKDRTDS